MRLHHQPISDRSNSGRRRSRHTGVRFTLIELLVVVAIISVLAAILLPVLGRARQQATNTVCISNLRQIGMGVLGYTDGNDSWYPNRDVSLNTFGGTSANNLKVNLVDDRRQIGEAVSVDFLTCPFSGSTTTSLRTAATSYVQSSYMLYFGSSLDNADPKSRLMRIGDTGTYGGQRHAVLAADQERFGPFFNNYVSGHRDRNGLMVLRVNSDPTFTTPSYYINTAGPVRGVIDRNFVLDDGSVLMLRNLTMDDARYDRVPWYPALTTTTAYTYLPRTN